MLSTGSTLRLWLALAALIVAMVVPLRPVLDALADHGDGVHNVVVADDAHALEFDDQDERAPEFAAPPGCALWAPPARPAHAPALVFGPPCVDRRPPQIVLAPEPHPPRS